MKLNKHGWLAGLLTASVLLLASCSNLTNGSVSGDPEKASEVAISLNLGNVNESGEFSRTILPDVLTTADIDYYTLSGKSQYSNFENEVIKGTDATNLAGSTGYVRNFTSTYWHLTIRAYKKVGATEDPTADTLMLMGTADIDLSTSTETTLSFSLSSYKVTTNGSYDLLLDYKTPAEWSTTNYSFKYGLYNIQTGEIVVTGSTAEESSPTTSAGLATAVATDPAGTWTAADGTTKYTGGQNVTNISASGIAPGSYTFGVTFYNSTTTYDDSTEIGYFSDVILIEPGQTTKKVVTIGAILGTVPAAPTNLGVQRIKGSEADGYYNARFYWTDNSSNEKYFKLVIKEYNSTATDAVGYTPSSPLATTGDEDTIKKGLVLDYKVFKETTGDIRYEEGSLFAGSTELILRLPTGRLFDAEIFAVNNLGESDSDTNVTGNQGCKRVDATSATTTLSAANPTASTPVLVGQTATGVTSLVGKTVEGYKITNTVTGEVTTVDANGASTATADKDVAVRVNLVQISYNLNGGTLKVGGQAQTVKTYVDYAVYDLDTTYTQPSGATVSFLDFSNIKLIDIAGQSSTYTLQRKLGTEDFDWSSWLNSAGLKVTHTNLYNDITVLAGYANNDLTLKITIAGIPEIDDAAVTARYGNTSGTAYVSTTGTDCKGGSTYVSASTEQFITVAVNATVSAKFKKFKLRIDDTDLEEKAAGSATTPSGATVFSNVSTAATPALQESGIHTVNVIGLMADGRYFSNTFTIDVRR